jgi:cytidine deaminase
MKKELIEKAREAAEKSYSPYSNFKVGAAVVGGSGKVYTGTNVENASFGLTVCAERNAIFAAVCAGEREIKALALTPDTYPCGACLQVMAEFAAEDFVLYIDGGEEYALADLLPKGFKLSEDTL